MANAVFSPELTLLHNPRCSKSREAKALLEERGVAFREHRYLEEPLTRADLDELRRRLGIPVREWIRPKEAAWAEAGLDAASTDAAILDAVAAHPSLLERPILVTAQRAIVGRPPERILALVD
jgi:arsenate reductase